LGISILDLKSPTFRAAILIFTLAIAAFAQQSAPLPKSAPIPHPSPKTAADYSNESVVIEKFVTTVRFENDGTGEREQQLRARVQNQTGVQQLGELIFPYNEANEKVELRHLRVEKKDGTIATATEKDEKDLTTPVARDAPVYTDLKEKHITVPALAPGVVVDYDVVTHIVKPLAPNEFWYKHRFAQQIIVLDERLEINVPAARKINLHSTDPNFTKEARAGRVIYRWKRAQLSNAPAGDSKDAGASAGEDSAEKDSSTNGKSAGTVELSTFTTWDDVASWYANLEKGRFAATPELRAKTLSLIEHLTTESEKIQALYAYVSKNIRYVSLSFGLGRYQPHTAEEVFANQYGDCKDKHTLLAAMLEVIGVHADAALIPSSHKLDTQIPSPSQFDHLITAIASGGDPAKIIWLDTTAEVAPYRYLIPSLRGKKALIVASDGAGRLAATPADPPYHSSQVVEIDGHVSDLGKLTAEIRYHLRGDNEFALRTAFRRTPQPQWNQIGQTMALLDGFHGEITKVDSSDPADTEKPFEMTLGYTQKRFMDWSSKNSKLTLPLPSLGMPDPPADSKSPIVIGAALDVSLHLKLALPPNESARAPVSVNVTRDYAEYRSSYEVHDNELTVERAIRFKLRELPATRSSDYLAFTRAVESDESQLVAIENSAAGTREVPATATAGDLVEAGAAALEAGNAEQAIDLFRRAGTLDPKRKDIWTSIGVADLHLRKLDDAIAAFKKQLEIDPFDANANNYLGVTLVQQQKFDEAAAAFKKQIELNPLDNFAHASLGLLLEQQRKFAEALPELDKAAVLTPDNPQLQVSLGHAYLETGKTTEAMAAFDKAVELSPTPEIWNNIAYDLVQKNVNLGKAQSYAQSAVDSTAAALRNIDIDHLTSNDLGEVQNIGAYWDTLGWIYFTRGDLEHAEPFLRASWQLTQNGDVGDHLAQLYAKQGKTVDAVRTYAEAITAPHADSGSRARLAALLSDAGKSDEAAKSAANDLLARRSFKVNKTGDESGEAYFYILVVPTEKSAKLESVKFIRGDNSLRQATAQIRTIDFGNSQVTSPPTKLLRRGKLTCEATAKTCTLLLDHPEDVRTVN
jgi:tetratricopeptide (TPR) repeat protein